jgi:BppU N-terminal domain/Glycosyl hydrolases family 28
MAFEYKEFPLALDLVEGTSAQSSNKKISLSQRDIGVSKILFSLTFRNVAYPIPTGAKVRLFIKRYNSGIVMQDETPETGAHVVVTDADNGKIEVLLNSDSIANAGQAEAQIEIELAPGKIMTSQKFSFFIEAALGANGGIISGNDIPLLDRALEVGTKFKNVDINSILNLNKSVDILKSQCLNVLEYENLKTLIPLTNSYNWQPVIQAALDSGKKAIFIPDGDFLVNSSILIPDDVTLVMSYNTKIIRNFSGTGSSLATIRNRNLSNTNRNRNIGLFGGCIKAADSSKTGKHIAFWGVDVVKMSMITTRETFGDWTTIFRDCTDVFGDLIDIDTSGNGIYTDGLHITGGKNYTFNNLIIKSGDDCISLTVETAEDTEIDGVTITNAHLTTRRASVVKMTTKTGTTPKIKNVRIINAIGIGGTVGSGEGIIIKDEDRAGRITDIELDIKTDCANGAGVGFRLDGVDIIKGKISIENPEGKGADISHTNNWDLEIDVKGQRAAGVSAITLAAVDSFELKANIENAKLHGIAVGAADLPATNGKIKGGRIKKSANTDIRLVNAIAVDVLDNYCSGANGIIEDSGSSDWNRIDGNDVRTVTGSKISSNGANSKIPNTNKGYTTYNRGTFTLPATLTSVKIPHGLSALPSAAGVKITLTSPRGAAGTIHRDIVSDGHTDLTVFTVAATTAPGVPVTFTWSAETAKYA